MSQPYDPMRLVRVTMQTLIDQGYTPSIRLSELCATRRAAGELLTLLGMEPTEMRSHR